jgi:hypothetical protein
MMMLDEILAISKEYGHSEPFLDPHHSHCPNPPFAFGSSPKPRSQRRKEICRLDLLVALPHDYVATHRGRVYAHFQRFVSVLVLGGIFFV